jgi:hypothetical protein
MQTILVESTRIPFYKFSPQDNAVYELFLGPTPRTPHAHKRTTHKHTKTHKIREEKLDYRTPKVQLPPVPPFGSHALFSDPERDPPLALRAR